MAKKIILYIHHGTQLGGALRSLAALIQNLDSERYQAIVAMPRLGAASQVIEEAGAKVVFGPTSIFVHSTHHSQGMSDTPLLAKNALLALPNAIFVRSLIRDLSPAIVHLNSSVLLAAGLSAGRTGVPVVWHVRENLAGGRFGVRRHMVRRIIGACSDRILAVSEATAQSLALDGTKVVYNGIDVEGFAQDSNREAVARELGLPPDGRYVGMIGNLIPEKGYHDFLEAACLLAGHVPSLTFLLVGAMPSTNGNLYRHMPSFPALAWRRTGRGEPAAAGDAPGSFVFTGFRKDVNRILSLLDVVVFPSWDEPLGRVLLEAGAAGKPAVATDAGGTSEVIVDGETGLLVPPRDPEALATAVLRLLVEDDLRMRMGEAAFQRISSCFNPRRTAQAVQEVYDELLRPADERGR